jgi:hypothetical protein
MQARPVGFDLAAKEGLDTLVELTAGRETWLLGTPLIPNALTKSSIERVEMPRT